MEARITTDPAIAFATLALFGCASDKAETPVQAIGSIIQLYEAGDFDTLIRTRYAEISKAEEAKKVQSLIDRFSKRYKDKSQLEKAVATYKSLLTMTPELSEDGKVATFKLSKVFVKLSLMPNGKWGFHL